MMALMNTLCLPMAQRWGCPMSLTPTTSVHVVIHSVTSVHNDYSCMCVCRVQRETDSQQTNKQTTRSHSPVAALLTPSKSEKGTAVEVHRECTRVASTEWTTHIALTWCVAGHCQRA